MGAEGIQESASPETCAYRLLTLEELMAEAANEDCPASGTEKRCLVAGCAGRAVVTADTGDGPAVELVGDCARAGELALYKSETAQMLGMLRELRAQTEEI